MSLLSPNVTFVPHYKEKLKKKKFQRGSWDDVALTRAILEQNCLFSPEWDLFWNWLSLLFLLCPTMQLRLRKIHIMISGSWDTRLHNFGTNWVRIVPKGDFLKETEAGHFRLTILPLPNTLLQKNSLSRLWDLTLRNFGPN